MNFAPPLDFPALLVEPCAVHIHFPRDQFAPAINICLPLRLIHDISQTITLFIFTGICFSAVVGKIDRVEQRSLVAAQEFTSVILHPGQYLSAEIIQLPVQFFRQAGLVHVAFCYPVEQLEHGGGQYHVVGVLRLRLYQPVPGLDLRFQLP